MSGLNDIEDLLQSKQFYDFRRLNMASGSLNAVHFAEAQGLLAVPWTA